MDRREAIKRTALLMGGILTSSAIATVVDGCVLLEADDWQPRFFAPEEAADMEAFAERLIPETDTPGARQAGVHRFVDAMLADVVEPEDQEAFRAGMARFRQEALDRYGKTFAKCSAEQQDELIAAWERLALSPEADQTAAEVRFYRGAKQLVFLGFFTSEAGATQVLQYDPIPGTYDGCIPLAQVGRAWAT